MLPALILALAALGSALLRLWAYRAQLLEMARVLEETPPESNLRLTVRTFGLNTGPSLQILFAPTAASTLQHMHVPNPHPMRLSMLTSPGISRPWHKARSIGIGPQAWK